MIYWMNYCNLQKVSNSDGRPPEDFDDWVRVEALVDSDNELKPLRGSTYQANNCYGGAILLALVEIVGINIQSV